MEDEVWLRLLGPVEIRNGRGGWLRPRGPQLRATLASLGLSAGRVVPLDELVDALWEDQSPRSARASVQILVARLRKALREVPDCKVERYGDGYLLQVGLGRIDVHQFRSLVKAARQATSHQDAIADLGRALTLWRGPALADVSATPRVEAIRAGLAEEQLSAAEDRFGHLLAAGRHTEAAEEIPHVLAAHPLAERLAELLMLAWYRCGRQGDALGVYRSMRARLADGLGVEPGPDLQRLHQLILAGDPALVGPDGVAAPARADELAAGQAMPHALIPGLPVQTPEAQLNGHSAPAHPDAASAAVIPRELPSPPARFTGRLAELTVLTDWLDEGTDTGGPMVLAICGQPGVGKTALALQWARQVQDRFPDGQLHIDLGGYGPSLTPASPAEAIGTILQSLGIPADQIARRADAGTGLYRSLLADRRMLVLLDNARDEAQVRPLLPGSPTSVVLVTSRSDLGGLVASHGARPLTLDVLSPEESWQLLASRVGADRTGTEDEAVTELVSICAGLPLALAIVASRAATRPAFQLATLAAELRGACRLDGLDTGDQTASIRAVFSWSYRMLSEPAARLFRLLGAHPGPDISAAAAASLSGTSAASARAVLSELVRANLVYEHVPDRFALHDLLRSYAEDQGDDGERRAAIRQALDYYLDAAYAAIGLGYPEARHTVVLPDLSGQLEQLTSPLGARGWLLAEHHVLLAAVGTAASNGFDEHAWQLSAILREHLLRSGHYADNAQAQRTALASATRLKDRAAEALSHRNLGEALIQLSSLQEASEHLGQALALYRELADQAGLAACHCVLGRLFRAQAISARRCGTRSIPSACTGRLAT